MSISIGNVGIVTNNLQLYYSSLSLRSFRGEATTNLVTNGDYSNGSNGWTFNSSSATYSEASIFRGKTCLYVHGLDSAIGRGYVYQVITVSSGTTYSLSFKYFLISGDISVSTTNAATTSMSSTTIGRWVTYKTSFSTTSTTLNILISGATTSLYSNFYITDIQLENKTYATPFVNGSRSANTTAGGGGLLDLSGKANNANLNSGYVQFDTDGYYFNQSQIGCRISPASTSELYNLTNQNHTLDCWVKLLGSNPNNNLSILWGREGWHVGIMQTATNALYSQYFYFDNSALTSGSISVNLNTWYHFACTVDITNSLLKTYLNGIQSSSSAITKALKDSAVGGAYAIGSADTVYCSNARIPICRAYNKTLSASEILQNYKAQKILFT